MFLHSGNPGDLPVISRIRFVCIFDMLYFHRPVFPIVHAVYRMSRYVPTLNG